MKRLSALLSAGVVVAAMTGCGLNPIGTPTITINPIDNIRVPAAGTNYASVTGKVEADTEITSVTYQILNSSDQPVNNPSVTGPDTSIGAKKIDFNDHPITITVTIGTSPGTYKLKISAVAGPNVSATFNFVVIANGGGAVSEKTNITLGAQSSPPHGLLDVNTMSTFSRTISEGATQALIDVIFSYTSAMDPDTLAFTSPDSAQVAPYDTWASKTVARYKKVSATWSTITTQAAITSLWNAGGPASACIAVSPNDIIIIQPGAGSTAYKAVQIVSVSVVNGTGPMSTIKINGKY
jgi:hypothetical protein